MTNPFASILHDQDGRTYHVMTSFRSVFDLKILLTMLLISVSAFIYDKSNNHSVGIRARL